MLLAHQRLFGFLIQGLDVLLILAAAACGHYWLCGDPRVVSDPGVGQWIVEPALLAIGWLTFSLRARLYASKRTETLFPELMSIATSLLLGTCVAATVTFAMFGGLISYPPATFAFALMLLAINRRLLRSSLRRLRAAGRNTRRALLVGRGDSLVPLLGVMREAGVGMKLLGSISFPDEDSRAPWGIDDLGQIDSLTNTLNDRLIDYVVVCPSPTTSVGDVHAVCEACDFAGIHYNLAPTFVTGTPVSPELQWYGDIPTVGFRRVGTPSFRLAVKRGMDILGASLGILLLSPMLIAVAVLIKLRDGHDVFFRQERVGKGGRHFWCLKFRTMSPDAEARKGDLMHANEQDGPVFKIRNDPRVTPIGRFLRKYSLDEVPQLFNVLAGDMSLVGPRPPVPAEVRQYAWWQRKRLSVSPGLTCIWQVWGRNRVSFERWVEMDLEYINSWSLWLDFKLMVHTLPCVFKGTGS